MMRTLLAMLCGVVPSAGASASLVQFSVDGLPVDGSVPIEVRPSDEIVVGVWVIPDAPVENFWVDFYPTGPWPAPPLAEVPDLLMDEDVVMYGPWANGDAFAGYDPAFEMYSIRGFLRGDSWAGPGGVATFVVHIPEVASSTILNLEYDYGEVGPGEAQVVLPLVLHVTPEPATIGLLVLGGLAALRRRFA